MIAVIKPYEQNTELVQFLHQEPDTFLPGNLGNPARFTWLVVTWWLEPTVGRNDTLWVKRNFYPDCNRIFWVATDADSEFYPIPAVNPPLPLDPLSEMYSVSLAALSLPPGQYRLTVKAAGGLTEEHVITAQINESADGWNVALPQEELASGANYIEVKDGSDPNDPNPSVVGSASLKGKAGYSRFPAKLLNTPVEPDTTNPQ